MRNKNCGGDAFVQDRLSRSSPELRALKSLPFSSAQLADNTGHNAIEQWCLVHDGNATEAE